MITLHILVPVARAMAVSALVAPALFTLGVGDTAHGAVGCTDGDRKTAVRLADKKAFRVPVPRVYSYVAGIDLRYSPELQCAWGLIVNASDDSVIWLERNTSGTRRLGQRHVSAPNTSAYTGVFNDRGATAVRACGKYEPDGLVACTNWY